MDLNDAYTFLNLYINKNQGAFYTMPELDLLVDRGQMSLYSDYKPLYGKSEKETAALAPFKTSYPYNTNNSPGGVVTIPANMNYIDFIDAWATVSDSSGTYNWQIGFPNEDERTFAIRSQVNPVTINTPIGEFIGSGSIQLYPKVPQVGQINIFRKPVAPHFAYTTVSGRVIVYDQPESTQLEWDEQFQNAVLLKALSTIGINVSEQDIQAYAETKTMQNFQGVNRT